MKARPYGSKVPAATSAEKERFARLWEDHYDFVRVFFTCRGFVADEAEDLLQEVFLCSWRALSSLSQDRDPRPWLVTIAINHLRMRFRRRQAEKRDGFTLSLNECRGEVECPARTSNGSLPDAEARFLGRELGGRIKRVLEELPSGQRTVAKLYFLRGHRYREIAEALGVSQSTVKSRLYAARISLRKHL